MLSLYQVCTPKMTIMYESYENYVVVAKSERNAKQLVYQHRKKEYDKFYKFSFPDSINDYHVIKHPFTPGIKLSIGKPSISKY